MATLVPAEIDAPPRPRAGGRRTQRVIVVGAGPGGLAAALLLARAGLDVHVVERLPFRERELGWGAGEICAGRLVTVRNRTFGRRRGVLIGRSLRRGMMVMPRAAPMDVLTSRLARPRGN